MTGDLLARVRHGDAAAEAELFTRLGDQLRCIAHRQMAGQASGHTLQTTALVHEAWLKLAGGNVGDAAHRGHFLAVAARAMRSVLVDHARSKSTAKRAANRRADVEPDALPSADDDPLFILDLEGALERLRTRDEQLAKIAELRCFAGASHEEIAAALDVSVRTVERGWRASRAWLERELESAR